jgi:cytochrome c oxidase subunit II
MRTVGETLDPQGPVAEAVAELWWWMLALGVAVFAVVAVLLVVGLFRRGPVGEPQPGEKAPNAFNRWMIGGGVVLPLLVLVVVLGATLRAMLVMPTTAPPDALVVEIVGHQWWWEVSYPEEGITTANEIHIPVGRPIAFRLTSADVIHSFWVPRLGGKIDMLPDGSNTLVLEADEPGEHHSRCAEFCGLQHANMGLVVVAEPQDRFASWVADLKKPAVEPTEATAMRGRDVFLASDCVSCHTIRGTSADAARGPDLTHLASRPTIGAGLLPNTPPNLADWVADPHARKPGVEMPPAELSGEQMDAVIAYLDTLK